MRLARLTAVSRSVAFLGAPIDDVTMAETLDRIVAMVREGRRTGRVHQVATVNVDFLVNAWADPELMRFLQRTDLSIPDGMPLVWGSKLLRTPLRERVAGADLPHALAARAAEDGLRLYFFGGAPGVAAAAADLLRAANPGLDVVADAGPRFSDPSEIADADIERIAAADADVVCVALGNPKQERFIAAHGLRIGAPVFIGVGGSLDFVTGEQRRAPRWMQRSGLEWIWRALNNPRRLAGRYARDLVVFTPRFVRHYWEMQPWRRRAGDEMRLRVTDDEVALVVATDGAPAEGVDLAAAEAAFERGATLVVDLEGADRVSGASASLLAEVLRRARRHGSGVSVRHGGKAAASLERLGFAL